MYEEDAIEIDLKEIWFAVRRWIVVICLAGILGGGIAYGVTRFLMTPIYTAENSMLVLAKETTLSSLADLQIGSQLTNDYKVLTTSRPVLTTVNEKLDLGLSYTQLKERITITNPSDTRILVIQVRHEDPEVALETVRTIAREASDYIRDTMDVAAPRIIDEGVVPQKPTSPSVIKNILIGILAGLFVSGGIVVLQVILDDTIKSEEDIEKHLGLSTLSVVPDRKDYISQGKGKKGKRPRSLDKKD